MTQSLSLKEGRRSQMGQVLIGMNLLGEPLFTLYNFVGFILYKDLGASALAISLMTMLKPIVTILSFYWSAGLRRGASLKANAMWAGFWMRAPFLLCPWIDGGWYVIGATVNYMFWYRAGIPAWLELVRRNMPAGKRARSFSLSSALAYVEGVALSLAMGGMLDARPELWRFFFFGAALLGLIGVALIGRVEEERQEGMIERPPLKELLVRPWRDSWELMRARPDFSRFQWGFMICGFGIMLIQPALPLFCVDWLEVSYLEMAAAISIAKGLGFALSSPLWSRWFERVSIFQVSSAVFAAFGLFPLMLALASWNVSWLYIAYFWYGVGQGGSHLVWNMSGPVFSGSEDSSRYTGVNVVMAGLRGAVGPGLGGWLAMAWGPVQVLCAGALFCFYSGAWLFRSALSQDPKKSLSLNG